jgi:hypothetical protein
MINVGHELSKTRAAHMIDCPTDIRLRDMVANQLNHDYSAA